MIRFWSILGLTAVATLVLAAVARRLGWGDAATGPAADRKLQRVPVPPVGGLAILIATSVFAGFHPEGGWREVFLLVLLVGLVDDGLARGLTPLAKVVLQALAVALPLGLLGLEWGALAIGLGASLAAMNVTNTFDNADGAVASVAAVGLAFVDPVLAAVPLGFLVFNLDAGALWRRGTGVPTAYLGDSGAYVMGLLLLRHGAWPALWIPLLDLLRLSVVRWRAGSRPWIGDRRHLAHRLQARGLGPIAVAVVLAGLAVPGCLGFYLTGLFPGVSVLGLALGALIYGLAVRLSPASQ